MKTRGIFLLALAGAFVLFNSVFVLDEREYAARFRFGETSRPMTRRGCISSCPLSTTWTNFPNRS